MSEQVRACPYCEGEPFTVPDPPPVYRSEVVDGGWRVTWSRSAWELPMVQHLFGAHPDRFAIMFPGVALVSEAQAMVVKNEQELMQRAVGKALADPLGQMET